MRAGRRRGGARALLPALAAAAVLAGGATAAVGPDDAAVAQQAVLRKADLPGAFSGGDASALAFLSALTLDDSCNAMATGLTVTGGADSLTYTGGPVTVQARVSLFRTADQAGTALLREARSLSARCARLRVSRVGFALVKLQVQDVPSLGAGAIRIRASLRLPSRPKTPVTADTVLAKKGRAEVRLWLVSVGPETAPGAGNALVQAMLKRLPAS